jgi:glycerophosphoryl diester phosphodiesterase
MSIRHRSAPVSALWIFALIASAGAQSIPLPREAQIGPRPFYLVDKMKEGPLKTELSQCTGPSAGPIFPSATVARRCNFPNTARNPILQRPAWAQA